MVSTPPHDDPPSREIPASEDVMRLWNDDGVLVVEAGMDQGQRHGRYRAWWDNGRLKEEGRYYRGTRVGLYRWFGEQGALLKEEDYGPGVL
jgi:antitoxin component YwqK of YwqJK toxin-antitoxin module